MTRTETHLPHMPKHLARPLVHLNGTSKDALYNAWIDADDAICKALLAVHRCAPNGRDYPLSSGDKEFRLALEQHQARVNVLVNLRLEYAALLEGLDAD